jgi:predicted hexulose-6-phosphate isomerase
MTDYKEYLLGLYEKSMPHSLSIKEKLAHAKKAGFDYMEISIDETEEKLGRLKWNRQKRQEMVHATWETEMPIISMCLSGHRKYPLGCEDRGTREKGMEIMYDAIQFAAGTGLRIIQIAGYDEYYSPSNENTKRLFLENLRKSVEMAASCGVILAFETMETEFLDTIRKAMYYVDMIASPYLQIYPDLGNITNAACLYGHAVLDDIQSGRGHLAAMHLKETVPGKYREIPYGTGHVDFSCAIKTALNMGVKLFVGEFWHNPDTDWKHQLTFANQFIRSKFNN